MKTMQMKIKEKEKSNQKRAVQVMTRISKIANLNCINVVS
jgi:hypothetical protein